MWGSGTVIESHAHTDRSPTVASSKIRTARYSGEGRGKKKRYDIILVDLPFAIGSSSARSCLAFTDLVLVHVDSPSYAE